MSELISMRGTGIRWYLLTTVSSLALVSSAVGTLEATAADDNHRPTVWIELGGQLEQMTKGQEQFMPPFVDIIPDTLFSPRGLAKTPQFSFGGEASISFQPRESDWVLSASVRFGRSNGTKHKTQLIKNPYVPVNFSFFGYHIGPKYYYPSGHAKFEDVKTQQRETHAILDFQVGKDVGLGIFGNRGASNLSAGVRIAQFTSKSNIHMRVEPDVNYPSAPLTTVGAWEQFAIYGIPIHVHDYAATSAAQRDFLGIGPSIAWSGSTAFAGNAEGGEISLDWGANAAVLFGRQKVRGHHQTTMRGYYGRYWNGAFAYNGPRHLKPGHFIQQGTAYATHQSTNIVAMTRSRQVTVPNLGGFAGISYRYANAKVSLGYRADFFFGAMDGGVDVRKSETLGFYGPFAKISVGLGG